MAVAAAVVLSLLKGASGREPVLHRVGGGRYTWAPNINFTQWASNEVFYVGDWLYFGFDKHRYSVLQVNKTCYDTCTDRDFIANITRGGRDVFNLTSARPYYFLSSGGYCFSGMRLAITVREPPPEDPTQPPPPILPRIQGSGHSTKVHIQVLKITTLVYLNLLFML
ncbi:hypothetical protein SAY87_012739 [Trapa incisa]|uniref:Phytocyanin domain-containing protein n=1 Tax=Trapa incisa TaxID=236973 RepID=A0AAN7H1G8_9MYRT|nr:hypothetical protein SAY87_012739 [Trapa incisa]